MAATAVERVRTRTTHESIRATPPAQLVVAGPALQYFVTSAPEDHVVARGQVLSREQLLAHVWGYFDPGSNVVDVYVGYLRKKIGSKSIETVRGMGYRLR